MTKPPRKYLDADRTDVNPEWLEWRDEMNALHLASMGPGVFEQYVPESVGKAIPEQGCWIRILEEPHTELKARFRLPVQSIWRAAPHTMSGGRLGGRSPQLAKIQTPGGELCLWPHEYDIVPDVTIYVGQDPDVTMHQLGGEPGFTVQQEEQLFYLQSRGLERRDAALLLLNDIEEQSFVYFTLSDELVAEMGSVGVPLWRYIQLHPRGVSA